VRYTPALDLPQPAEPGRFGGDARPGHGVGQTLVLRHSPLERLDLQVSHEHDHRPGVLHLWKWQGSWETTVSSTPLFSDVVDFTGGAAWQTRSFFPHLAVEVGATYFLEVTGPGRGIFSLLGDRGPADRYPDGRARVNGGFPQGGESWDLWLRTWSLPQSPEPTPPFPSLPGALPWHAPLRARDVVPKRDYYQRYEAFADLVRASALGGCGERSHGDALPEAFLYRASCEGGDCAETRARNAIALLLRAHAWRFCAPIAFLPSSPCPRSCDPQQQIGSPGLEQAALAFSWVRGSPSLRPADRARIREFLADAARRHYAQRELGTHNRALLGAAGLRIVAGLFPDEPDAPLWRGHAEAVWAGFWAQRDTEEDSASYAGAVWWPAVLSYAEAAGLDASIWSDPGFRALVERFFHTTAPAGVPPDHGDSSGSLDSAAGLVWLFEKAAARTRDPRYRWLAQRIYEYNRTHARHDPPQHDSLVQFLPQLGRAWLDADESLAPAAPPAEQAGSTLTTRARAHFRPKESWGEAPWRVYDLGPERVPDKLVLRSGFGAEDFFAVFNLLAGYGHGQTELGALVLLMDRGSLLSGGTPLPYWFHSPGPQDESAPFLRRYRGGRPGEPGTHVEVTRFADARRATVAWLEWNDPSGWNVRQERRLYFVKNRFLLVRDRFTFPDPIEAAAGPVWHAADLRPAHGANWYDVFQREPVANVTRFRNPERSLLLYFVPREGFASAAFEEASYLPAAGCPRPGSSPTLEARCRSSPPYVLTQRWTGEARAGETRWFDTLLLPHGPEQTPEGAAEGVRVLLADPQRVALEVRIGAERWTLLDNPGGAPLEAPGLATDATYLILGTAPGEAGYLLGHEVSRVELGETSERWPERTSAELALPPLRD